MEELPALAERIEGIVKNGGSRDPEMDHLGGDAVLIEALEWFALIHPEVGRIIAAWKSGSTRWWWA